MHAACATHAYKPPSASTPAGMATSVVMAALVVSRALCGCVSDDMLSACSFICPHSLSMALAEIMWQPRSTCQVTAPPVPRHVSWPFFWPDVEPCAGGGAQIKLVAEGGACVGAATGGG